MHNALPQSLPTSNHFGHLIDNLDPESVALSPRRTQTDNQLQPASDRFQPSDMFASFRSLSLEAPQETARYDEMRDPNWAEKEFLDFFEKSPRSPKQTGFEMSFHQVSTVSAVPSPTDRRFPSLHTSFVSPVTQAMGTPRNQSSSVFFANNQQQKPITIMHEGMRPAIPVENPTAISNVFITSSYSVQGVSLTGAGIPNLTNFPVFSTALQQPFESREDYLKRLERQVKIERYKAKKRNWKKKVAYTCRKQVAEKRLRIKGRFLSKEDSERLLSLYGQDMKAAAPLTEQAGFIGTHNNLNIEMIPGEEFVKVSDTKRRKLKVVRDALHQIKPVESTKRSAKRAKKTS